MFDSDLGRHPALLLAGALVLAGSACAKGADQQKAADSATSMPAVGTSDTASPTAGTTISDTGARLTTSAASQDTTSTSASPAETERPKTSTAAAAPVKPRVRPNIDPGRVSTKPKNVPASGAVSTSAGDASSSPAASTTSASQSASSSQQGEPVKYDAASNTATFELIGGPRGFQFNGYASGGATLTLPPKAKVVINFINKDGTPHSAEVISGEGPIPNAGGDPALPRAFTNQLLQGLPQEGTDNMQFTVPASGSYRIFCGVPGHGLSGMWIWMKVDPAAKTASFGPTKS
jgi:sulfocyanin SoxE-like protein